MLRCAHIDDEGKCQGKYKGFACIKDKCLSDEVKKCAYSTEEGYYCLKFNRFECIGLENCGTLNDYMNFIRLRKEKAHSST
jgi:hypothetical protein